MLIEDFSFTVIEEEGQFVVVEREEGEAGFRVAELFRIRTELLFRLYSVCCTLNYLIGLYV